MAKSRLTPQQIGKLRDLLLAAFIQRDRFAEFLYLRLNKRLGNLTSATANDDTAYFNVVDRANAEYWWLDLLREARNVLPTDPELLAFAQSVGMAPGIVENADSAGPLSEEQLELKIDEASSTLDVLKWREQLGRLESQVCRIEYPEGKGRGTGFLVAANVVMTNYHVVKRVHENDIDATAVAARFDYKVASDGITVGKGVVYKLAPDWLLDFSRPSELDSQTAPASDPDPTELDYALLRIQGKPGDDPVGGATKDWVQIARGWIEVPPTPHDFGKQPALYILQHPDGAPLKLALDTRAVLKVNGNGTRVRYRTTTEPGSSGSPCFGPNWEWVALHHAGDPNYYDGGKPKFNQGIPLPAIHALLKQRGKLDLLGKRT